ncbi:MAG: TIGR00725 family protein [Candidatus Zapsychrus exili]|nr:TIGR00725 family protein [Candidatus Zapsychrus exili]
MVNLKTPEAKEKEEIIMNQKIVISVIGGHDVDEDTIDLAYKVGSIVAKSGAILACGGLFGVMEAASKGAKEAGGLTIGLLPGKDKQEANPYIDIALPTTIGYARNAMVVASANIVIALPGSHGTLSEICYGLVYKRPIIDLGNWDKDGLIKVDNLEDLSNKIAELISEINV